MSDMSDAIDLVCEKLGATLDTLIPAATTYGIAHARLYTIVGIVLILLSLVPTMYWVLTYKRDMRVYNAKMADYTATRTWPEPCMPDSSEYIWLLLPISLLATVGILFLACNVPDLVMWHRAPEYMAYKLIAGLLHG